MYASSTHACNAAGVLISHQDDKDETSEVEEEVAVGDSSGAIVEGGDAEEDCVDDPVVGGRG